MRDRRFEPRIACSAPVEIRNRDAQPPIAGGTLCDVSLSGARLRLDRPVPVLGAVDLLAKGCSLTGVVRYCGRGDLGYVVGVEFDGDSQQSAMALVRAVARDRQR